MKRVILFLATNLAVVLVLSVVLKLLGLDGVMYSQTGTSYGGLLAFSAVVGYVVYGLLLAIAWVRLSAVDVALTEAAIGGGMADIAVLPDAPYTNDKPYRMTADEMLPTRKNLRAPSAARS